MTTTVLLSGESARFARLGTAIDSAEHYAEVRSIAMDAYNKARRVLDTALASTPASLAGRYRGKVLREAADVCFKRADDSTPPGHGALDMAAEQACSGCGHALRTLADEAEK
jgi:hypothetical protein